MPGTKSITAEEFRELHGIKAKTNKYNAEICERNGFKFASKLERKYYDQLLLRQRSKEVIFFLRQVPIHLASGVKYLCDFLVFFADGHYEFIDTKGRDTPLSIAKRKMVESMYPIEIKIVTR